MIVDSMRHWTDVMHVDGFRVDLASVFARGADGAIGPDEPPLFGAISGDPDFARLRLIAEPWDPAGAMELGRAFPGVMWQQWNAAFRDDVRRFVRGDDGLVPALMRRLYGSDDLFPDDRMHAYHAWRGVNYVTCHDGHTLDDLVAADAPAEHTPWHHARQARNLLALLLLANGTPMLRARDEFLQTQGGDGNPWNRDDATTWLDWRRLDTHRELFRFTRLMIAFRKAHPSIARSRFWRGDVHWYGVGRWPDLAPHSHALAYCLCGASEGDDDLYVMINAWREPLAFEIQEGEPSAWRRVVDPARPSPNDVCEPGGEAPVASRTYVAQPRSVVVLLRRLDAFEANA